MNGNSKRDLSNRVYASDEARDSLQGNTSGWSIKYYKVCVSFILMEQPGRLILRPCLDHGYPIEKGKLQGNQIEKFSFFKSLSSYVFRSCDTGSGNKYIQGREGVFPRNRKSQERFRVVR